METIDILLATYNGEKFLEEQIKSILNQSYTNWRLLISDDGSTDRTISIINKYVDEEKIILVRGKKFGNPRDNFLNLLNYSNSEWLMFADQDDYWKENKILNAYNSVKEYNKKNFPIVSYSDLFVTDEELNTINSSFFRMQRLEPSTNLEFFLTQNCIAGCTTIFNRKMKEYLQMIKNPKNLLMHDWAMGIIGATIGKVIYNKSTDILYRQHGNNSVGANDIYSIKFLLNKVKYLTKIKENIKSTQTQTAEIYKSLKIKKNINDSTNINLLKVYANFTHYSKIKRILYCYKYGISRKNVLRNLILLLFC